MNDADSNKIMLLESSLYMALEFSREASKLAQNILESTGSPNPLLEELIRKAVVLQKAEPFISEETKAYMRSAMNKYYWKNLN